MTTAVKPPTVEQMDERLSPLREPAREMLRQKPGEGWVKAIRQALGMSDRSFAKRLGVLHGSVQELERNERRGSVTLESLRRAAEVLDADLVYAIVPRKPLRTLIRERALALATERLSPIARSMAPEGQTLSTKQLERQIAELAAELETKPRELWR